MFDIYFRYHDFMKKEAHRTVWSSEHGDLRKKKEPGTPGKAPPSSQQTIYLHRDSKGRGGKAVTLVKNLVLSEESLKELSKQLKQVCGSGGTVKNEQIEIQGEHREKIAEFLRELGYRVKIAGG